MIGPGLGIRMAAICPDVGRMRVPLQGGAVDIPLGLSMLAWCGMGGRARKDICGRLGIARFFLVLMIFLKYSVEIVLH